MTERIPSQTRRPARRTAHATARAVALATALCAGLATAAPATAPRPDLDAARALVERLADDAVRTWRTHAGDEAARREAMGALIRSTFHVEWISRTVLGRHWRVLDEDERSRFRERLQALVVEVYLPHLARYERDRMRVVGARPRGRRDVAVLTELRTDTGGRIEAHWRVRATADGLRIIDLVVEGVSLLRVQREELTAAVQRHGFEGLMERLRERTRDAASTQSHGWTIPHERTRPGEE